MQEKLNHSCKPLKRNTAKEVLLKKIRSQSGTHGNHCTHYNHQFHQFSYYLYLKDKKQFSDTPINIWLIGTGNH